MQIPLTGRLRQIYEGTSDLPRLVENQYRRMWGLEPLPADKDTPCGGNPGMTQETGATLQQQVITFAAALMEHVRDGMTRCTDREISERLKVCETCPDLIGNHCRLCGCACNGRQTFLNKLAWRSEKCPAGKWH